MRTLIVASLLATASLAWAIPISVDGVVSGREVVSDRPLVTGRPAVTARDGVTARTGITPRLTHCAHFDPGVCATEGVLDAPIPPLVDLAGPTGLLGRPHGAGPLLVASAPPVSATPEPATLILLGSTLAAVGWWRRRR